jgi:predicted DNA-binding transcriptional regulator YafY
MPTKRSERLFHLINILRSGKGYGAAELARITGVSLRTLYRDVVDLSSLVPVYYDKGYRLLPESYIANLTFTREELLAIKTAMKVPALAKASHLAAASRSALIKINEQLDRRFGDGAHAAAEDIDVHMDANPLTTAMVRTLRVLEEAIAGRRTVQFAYRAAYRDERTKREVDPYGLTFRVHSWYLIGRCHLRKCERVFRLDRIEAAKILPGKFTRPDEFSLEGFFADSWEVYTGAPRARVVVRFAAGVGSSVRPRLARWGAFRDDDRGDHFVFEGLLPVSEEFARWLLNFGGDAEVLEPDELRAMVAARVFAAAGVYQYPGGAASGAVAKTAHRKKR